MKVLRFIEDIGIHQRINPKIRRYTTAFNEAKKRLTYKSIKGIYIKQNLLDSGTGMTGKTMNHSNCIIVGYSKTPNCVAVVVMPQRTTIQRHAIRLKQNIFYISRA